MGFAEFKGSWANQHKGDKEHKRLLCWEDIKQFTCCFMLNSGEYVCVIKVSYILESTPYCSHNASKI